MAKYMKIANKTEIGPGEIKGFSMPSSTVLIANLNGRYYAMDSVCPHAHAPLEDGIIDGKTLKCPGTDQCSIWRTGGVFPGPL
jgi:3-phenylpropionate/trans-cinnamate dioxygenase ferredoxin subunit